MKRLGLVRRLPGPLRRPLVRTADKLREYLVHGLAALEPPVAEEPRRIPIVDQRPRRPYVGERVVVAGYFSVRSGLQRGADLTVLGLRAKGVPVLAFDMSEVVGLVPDMETAATRDLDDVLAWQPTDVVLHINPPEYIRAIASLPTALVATAAVIPIWVWELNVVSQVWRDCAADADEIWTPSPFVAETLALGIPEFTGPVRVVPYPVDQVPMKPADRLERQAVRNRLGVPTDVFTIGYSFAIASNYARKNPCAAIDAFRRAFKRGERARLVIRCHDVSRFPRLFQHLVSYAGDDDRILIWDTSCAACSITDFYALLDLYLSLHRSEGYGLSLVEASQAGVDVVATGWGLAPDIKRRPNIHTVGSRLVVPLDTQAIYEEYEGGLWAEPDTDEAAALLARLYVNWTLRHGATEPNRAYAS